MLFLNISLILSAEMERIENLEVKNETLSNDTGFIQDSDLLALGTNELRKLQRDIKADIESIFNHTEIIDETFVEDSEDDLSNDEGHLEFDIPDITITCADDEYEKSGENKKEVHFADDSDEEHHESDSYKQKTIRRKKAISRKSCLNNDQEDEIIPESKVHNLSARANTKKHEEEDEYDNIPESSISHVISDILDVFEEVDDFLPGMSLNKITTDLYDGILNEEGVNSKEERRARKIKLLRKINKCVMVLKKLYGTFGKITKRLNCTK
ncbi:hypothetical protein SLOPH_2426 [Spraguea lophii 42_110]|uniref:Uncharacterized protein n=1 Tax=Spraguea lophii (strain 42_110) TaxID=1358809 RepID=S7XVB5_SPRLO|nr:hypothetical protein SLOPH_2426 [Spraguea lophii 42_110]